MNIPKVQRVIGEQFISRIITTSNGEQVAIPKILGRATDVIVRQDGKFEITQHGNKFLGLTEKKSVLSEEELISQYGKYTGKKLKTIG